MQNCIRIINSERNGYVRTSFPSRCHGPRSHPYQPRIGLRRPPAVSLWGARGAGGSTPRWRRLSHPLNRARHPPHSKLTKEKNRKHAAATRLRRKNYLETIQIELKKLQVRLTPCFARSLMKQLTPALPAGRSHVAAPGRREVCVRQHPSGARRDRRRLH